MAFDYLPLWDRYRELFEPLQPEEIGRLVLAMQDYKDGKIVEFTGNERFVWPSIRRDIDNARAAYDETCRRQRENGSKGGRPRKATSFNGNPKNPVVSEETQKSKINNKDKDNNNITTPYGVGNTRTRTKRFVPPTVADVTEYCQERSNKVDPQRFVDYYAANGWKVGKNPMKDWKAAVRTWERNGFDAPQKASRSNKAGADVMPDTDRIQKSGDWLDKFLAAQESDKEKEG